MPERTTPKQRMIAIVRQHLAQPGVTVTESKMLFDHAAGKMREVDVVAEGDLDGDAMILSVEVTECGDPAALTWVDQMLGKHSTLPTNKLVLVSWSGFTSAAFAKAKAVGAVPMEPTPVLEADGTPRHAEALYVDQFSMAAERVTVTVRSPDGTVREAIPVATTTAIYDEDGNELGSMDEVVTAHLRSEHTGRRLGIEAHGRQDRENLNSFTLRLGSIDQRIPVYVQNTGVEPAELLQITAVEIVGRFSWQQTELRFAVVNIDGRAHGIAQAPWLGKDAVWVATPKNDGTDEVQLGWRTMDAPAELESSWGAAPPTDRAVRAAGTGRRG